MRKALRLLSILLLVPLFSQATHVVGGSLTYEQLGGSTYRVTLKLYRDCRPGNAAFPNPVVIEVRDANGNTFTPSRNITIAFPGATAVQPYIDTCAVNPGLCLEEAIYTRVVNNLPPQPGGYHLYYQYCCRNSTLSNVVNPLNTGETWYAHIPDNTLVMSNSSPAWVNPPPVFVCQGRPINFDHSATDSDGDSLVYSYYTPYTDAAPTFSSGNANFTPITWVGGFGPNNPCGGANLTLNTNTGYISGTPNIIGQFVAGIRCEEYRNGVKIGEILRDFQFNVIYCPPLAQAGLGPAGGTCAGSTVVFNNTSDPANSYYWDFGDGTTTLDTSTQQNPSYTYPGFGPYTVTLIINYGTPCADTATQQVELSYATTAFTPSNDSTCVGQPVSFTDNSTPSPNSTITGWYWDYGDGSPTDTTQNPSHTYLASGTYTVTHTAVNSLGCTDTITQLMHVIAPPIALAGNDTLACTNNATVGLGGNVLNATGGMWIGNGTFNPSPNVLNATYTPTAAETSQGFADLLLLTTGNGICSVDTDTVRITFTAGPTVAAGNDIFVCRDTAYVPVNGNVTVASGGQWTTTGSGTFANPNNLSTNYLPSAADTSAGSVVLVLTTTGNGTCLASNDSVTIFFSPPPNVYATAADSACSGVPFPISASTATGAGTWSTLGGDGSFPGGTTSLNSSYQPGINDAAVGSIILVFTTTNNGGCQPQRDTVTVTLIPSPTGLFATSSVCPGVAMPFNDQSTSVTPITNWSWNFGDSSPNNTSQNPTHVYANGGTYSVTLVVTSSNGCIDTTVMPVTVYPFPDPAFTSLGYCQQDGMNFTDQSTVPGGTVTGWLWNFGDGSPSDTSQNPHHVFGNAGNFNVTLIAVSNYGCMDTLVQSVLINPSPVAGFSQTPPTANIQQPVNFTDQSYTNIVSWYWEFGDSTAPSTQQNPTHIYQQSGTYHVMLVVTDANGCTDTVYNDIIISTPPSVPSGFTPNGDGHNDLLNVLGGPFTDVQLDIYNNWGELIYTIRSQGQGWDGNRNGQPQPMGVYVYTGFAVTPDGKKYDLHGDVTLIR